MTWMSHSRWPPKSPCCTTAKSWLRGPGTRSKRTAPFATSISDERILLRDDATPMPLLEVRAIHTYYGESHILHGVDLSVSRGQVVALLGRNGVGKTTTVRSIVGFTPPRRGNIKFKGKEIAGLSAQRIARTGISLIPQGRRVFGSLTVREHLKIFAT